MPTWTVHWTMDGYTDIDADTLEEARAVFDEMTPSDMQEMGDYERPEAYHFERNDADTP